MFSLDDTGFASGIEKFGQPRDVDIRNWYEKGLLVIGLNLYLFITKQDNNSDIEIMMSENSPVSSDI